MSWHYHFPLGPFGYALTRRLIVSANFAGDRSGATPTSDCRLSASLSVVGYAPNPCRSCSRHRLLNAVYVHTKELPPADRARGSEPDCAPSNDEGTDVGGSYLTSYRQQPRHESWTTPRLMSLTVSRHRFISLAASETWMRMASKQRF